VDLPNKEERSSFIYMKIERNPALFISDLQVDSIALRSTGMSLSELDTILEAALRSALRAGLDHVTDEAVEEAFEAFHNGEKKEWDPATLERTARHEAGHALLCWLAGEKPMYLTIVARGDHGGYMQHGNEEGKGIYTRAELLGKIRTSLGGRAAELVYYGEEDGVSTGASGDLHSATRVAEQMICNYGMDASVGLSYVSRDSVDSAYYGEIRRKINALLQDQLNEAVATITANKAAIDRMVEVLMEKNHLKGNEIDEIFRSTVVESKQ
jgi:ATP-dependent Zn protease